MRYSNDAEFGSDTFYVEIARYRTIDPHDSIQYTVNDISRNCFMMPSTMQ